MTRRVLVLVALSAVVLAGCLGGPGTGTETTTEPMDSNGTATVSSETIPGVSDGTVTNATVLAQANEARLTETGGAVKIRRDSATSQSTFDLVVGAGLATYRLTGFRSAGNGTVDADIWSNETTRVIRMNDGGEYNYRTTDRRDDRLTLLDEVRDYLAAGNFTVANDSTGNGTVVFTADTFVTPVGSHDSHTNGSALDGRLVVSESGLIRSVTVSTSNDQERGSYSYELRRTGIDRVTKPDWFDSVPDSVTLQTEFTVDVENSSYLVVRNDGGDHVPSNTTISVTSDNTTATATLDTELVAGDTRYAYIDATTGTLQLSADRPTSESVDSLISPISVSVTTDGGASLYSGGMAWSSESASAPETGNAGGSSGGSGGSAGSTSAGGSSRTGTP